MNRPDEGGGTYSSIQPDALNGVVTGLQKTIDGISTLGGFSGRFATGGVSTAHLDKLTGFSPTLSELIPELTRRVSLARAMVAKNGGKTAYFTSDSLGPFKTVADAKAQALKDAKAIDDGDGLTDDALKNLQKYGLDPDYAAALLQALGPKTTYKMLYNNNMDPDGDKTVAITNFLQTATLTVPIDGKFLKEGADAYDKIPSLTMLAPYLKEGVWPDKQLEIFADMYVDPQKYPEMGPILPDDSTLTSLLAALQNNVGGGAKYMATHQDAVYDLMRKTMNTTDDLSKAWAGYMHTATIEARNAYGIDYLDQPGLNPAILNAEYLMKKAGGDDDWPEQLHDTFAAMGSVYLADYARTVGSPIDPGSVKDPRYDGLSVSVADWQSFLKQGMYTDAGVTTLAAAFQQQISLSRESASNGDQSNPDSVYWDHYLTGALQRTFTNLYHGEEKRRGDDADDMESGIEDLIDKGIDFTLDPGGTLKDVGVDAVKGLLHDAVDVKPDALPGLPSGFDTKANYAYYAADYLHDKGGKFPPVKENIGGGTTITWTGDPKLYAEPSPPNGDFTASKFHDGDGKIDVDKLKSDPDAWRSYNEWLHDPAVQAQVSPGFSQDFDGAQEGR